MYKKPHNSLHRIQMAFILKITIFQKIIKRVALFLQFYKYL